MFDNGNYLNLYPVKDIVNVFQQEVGKFTKPVEFGAYIISEKQSDNFSHVIIPKTLGVDLDDLKELLFGRVRSLPALRKINDTENSYKFGLQVYSSPILPDLEIVGDRESFIPGDKIILAKDISLAEFYSAKRLKNIFPDWDGRTISDEEIAQKITEKNKDAGNTHQFVIENGRINGVTEIISLDEPLEIESFGTKRHLYTTPEFTINTILRNQHLDKNLGFVHTHNSYPRAVIENPTGYEGEYALALEKYAGPHETSLTLLSPEDVGFLLSSQNNFRKIVENEQTDQARNKIGSRLTVSGVLAFDDESRQFIGQRWFEVNEVEKDVQTYDNFINIAALAFDTLKNDEPDYEGVVREYWQMMLDLSYEGPFRGGAIGYFS